MSQKEGWTIFKPQLRPSLELVLMIAIALGVLLRIIHLSSRELWYDEVLSLLLSTSQKLAYQTPDGDTPVVLAKYTALLNLPVETGISSVIKTLRNLLHGLLGGEPHPPLFFISQHLWLRFFGNTEAAMRSLNVLFSIAAIGSAYGLGRVLLGHRGGLLLSALLAVNPFYLFHSLNLRMYAPLVFWGILSAWSLLNLIFNSYKSKLLWNILLIISIASGLLTFYLYVYWVIALAVLAIYLDRQHWLQHGLRLGAGVLLTLPWGVWGTLKQLRNADLQRFGGAKQEGAAWLIHLQDVVNNLGIHLFLGDWITSLPPISSVIAGCVISLLLVVLSINLWQNGEQQNLGVALILGIFPLLLALVVDIITKKFTLGFGWGRTMIMILPGCLLLLALGLQKGIPMQWRTITITGLLLLYLTIGLGDYSLRQRSMFHKIADVIAQEPNTPTLIAMNSQAWGHVMRLAYYLPPTSPIILLAEKPVNLGKSLEKLLNSEAEKYYRIIWLDSDDPVWSRLKTAAEKSTANQQVQAALNSRYQLIKTQELSGTMTIDNFSVKLYKSSV
ncbi:MAG: glycosyltransferase family 39 protein [Nostocaceae cyanobacterium]|nr:glycosyltransferase family 39 protein [Nostocaceae cyanobacterium]